MQHLPVPDTNSGFIIPDSDLLLENIADMRKLIVHKIPGAWGLSSTSPFCLKLETCLKMANVPHEIVVDRTPFKGPKKKLPWIEHEEGEMGDSNFILDFIQQEYEFDLNVGLTAPERAVSCAMKRMMEENLYWVMVYDRWMVDRNWETFRNVVLGGIPQPARSVMAPFARRGVKNQLIGHGIGLHSGREIHSIGIKDITAIADFLADKPYLMGDKPTQIDAVAFGLLANILKAPIESPVRDEGLKRANLLAYIEKMQARYYA